MRHQANLSGRHLGDPQVLFLQSRADFTTVIGPGGTVQEDHIRLDLLGIERQSLETRQGLRESPRVGVILRQPWPPDLDAADVLVRTRTVTACRRSGISFSPEDRWRPVWRRVC